MIRNTHPFARQRSGATRVILLTVAAVSAFAPPAQAKDWTLDPAGSSLEFAGAAQGEQFEGRFQHFAARIAFDAGDLARSRFDVDIELGSADTQNSERDETLLGSDFFDAAGAQPRARYLAERFEALPDGRYRALGTLTLKGISQPVALDFSWNEQPGAAELSGETRLDRTAFGVGLGDWEDAETIAHEVQVRTRLRLTAP